MTRSPIITGATADSVSMADGRVLTDQALAVPATDAAPDKQCAPSGQPLGDVQSGWREAVVAMFEAREALEIAPTHNSKAFDKALADHAVTLETLRKLLAESGDAQ